MFFKIIKAISLSNLALLLYFSNFIKISNFLPILTSNQSKISHISLKCSYLVLWRFITACNMYSFQASEITHFNLFIYPFKVESMVFLILLWVIVVFLQEDLHVPLEIWVLSFRWIHPSDADILFCIECLDFRHQILLAVETILKEHQGLDRFVCLGIKIGLAGLEELLHLLPSISI